MGGPTYQMALTWGDLTSKTNSHIVPRLIDTIYRTSALLTRIRTRNTERFEGGDSLKVPIMHAELKGGPFTRGGTFDCSYVESDTALNFLMKPYYVNVSIYGLDCALNRGPEAAMTIIDSKMANAGGKMAKLLATDMYLDGQGTASSAIALDGFSGALDDGSNFPVYGQITRTDLSATANTGINAYYKVVATLSLKEVQTAFGSTWFGGEHADLLTTTQAVWDIWWNKLQPQQRFNEESSDVGKIGFQSFRYNSAQVVVDQHCPAGKLWFLNMKYVNLYLSTMPQFQFGFTGSTFGPLSSTVSEGMTVN